MLRFVSCCALLSRVTGRARAFVCPAPNLATPSVKRSATTCALFRVGDLVCFQLLLLAAEPS